MGNRMSSLPIAQYCSASAVLGDKHGAGRSAAISKAFHAIAAGEDPEPLLAKLSPVEEEEALSLHPPTPLLVKGQELHWKDAEREVELCLKRGPFGPEACGPEEAASVGHADAVWVLDSLVVVADIKLSHFTATPDSLQLHAYGVAAAVKHGKPAYMRAIWSASNGTWSAAPVTPVAEMAEQVLLAAENTSGEYAAGDHCSECWARWHCSEHLLPLQNPVEALEPFTKPGGVGEYEALEALHLHEALKSLQKVLKKNLEDYAAQNGGIRSDGKVWTKVEGKNPRQVFDSKAFKKDHPDLFSDYSEEKPPKSMGYRWVKENPNGK